MSSFLSSQENQTRMIINLNGTWDFEQTLNAYPPGAFTRKIPVPGLIHLAEPKIQDYDKFFQKPEKAERKFDANLYDINYTPKYSWYRKKVFIPQELENLDGVITIKKSQFVTHVYINGMEAGSSMACFTPVEFQITRFLKYGEENEILIRVGDRTWLPAEAAGGTDKEKEHYLPGIWDDVLLSFTDKFRVERMLVLPSASQKKVTVKFLVRNFNSSQIFYGDPISDSVVIDVSIYEKLSGTEIAHSTIDMVSKRDNLTETFMEIKLDSFKLWTPDSPNLYIAEATLRKKDIISDRFSKQFGMRDFTRKGKYFYLNNELIKLRGTNITLHRFFEDPDCGGLAWDKNWVKKLLADIPKQMEWNAMRICVGIAPDFWYDLADEHGLMFQNEWMYWQNHGWDEQIKKEYTNWVWNDGSHPSIVIWDAINENWDEYIGNTLIPELKKLDPTRIWDAGYMTGEHMITDEMDEPHPYTGFLPWLSKEEYEESPYTLGNLEFPNEQMHSSKAAQLVNEYGWVWLWRNGQPSKLTLDFYKYYLGENSTIEQNREFQAYWLQLETEMLRCDRSTAGVLAFCYLTNNYGYTGDWFIDNIKDLRPGITLDWFKHCFAPAAVFINLPDGRYNKHIKPYKSGVELDFSLFGVNDLSEKNSGRVVYKLLDDKGITVTEKEVKVNLAAQARTDFSASLVLPEQPGGYLLLVMFYNEHSPSDPVISRRYIKIGEAHEYKFFEYEGRRINK